MTWQLASYGLLALVLAGGFAWYERSRPPARMVALVAALAALAVAGRLAFAPIPNVVATTDIVLITGFALGAAPGFAVGALAAAVSNLWLGQGPWTPWEMAGWGLVGLGGAGLAAATRGRLGRIGLATACGLAGLAYGALLDYSVMAGYGGEQSLARYLAISARGIPFNVAHAVGNVALALAAGPALVRMISRYRRRFEFEWPSRPRRPRATTASLFALLAVAVAVASAPPAHGRGPASAALWLERAQRPDGGFPASAGGPSSPAITGWAALGLEAAGKNPLDTRTGGHSAIGFLRATAKGLRSTGDLERTILALAGAGVSPRRFGGRDLVGELRRRRSPSGSFENEVNLTAFGILALRAGGLPGSATRRSAAWLREAQNRDGGWGFEGGAGSDPDSTGAALQGLVAASGRGRPTRRGASYLRRVQRRDGGYALAGANASNSQSTAWAVQGLVAAGANPAAVRTAGRSPLDYLARRQAGDGHYRYSSASDQTPVWVTGQALVAVEREAFPLSPVPRVRSSPTGAGGPRPHEGRSGAASAGKPGGPGPGAGAAAWRGPAAASRGGREARSPAGPGERGLAVRSLSAPAERDAPAGEGGGPLALYFGGGLAALAAALAAGFAWYRRRLP